VRVTAWRWELSAEAMGGAIAIDAMVAPG